MALTSFPSLLDLLYRFEVRRYWTWRRYLATALTLAGWWGLVLGFFLVAKPLGRARAPGDIMLLIIWTSILCRVPLSCSAAAGAALSVAPEKASGQIEQFLLTPVDTWRFCLTRYMGRLAGMFLFWAGGASVFMLGLVGVAPDLGRTSLLTFALLLVVLWASLADMAVMLMLDAAVGLRFSASSPNGATAVTRTFLVCFLLLPALLSLPVVLPVALAARHAVPPGVMRPAPGLQPGTICIGALVRLGLGALGVWVALRAARRSVEKVFFRPGEA